MVVKNLPDHVSKKIAQILILASILTLFGVGVSSARADSGNVHVVTKIEDTSDGVCDEDCSLREAIDTANPGDRVELPPGIFTVGSELAILLDLNIVGTGAGETIIQASDSLATSTHGVFAIYSGSVGISGLTIRHGNGVIGGGILVEGTSAELMLADSTVKDNFAFGGGGIANNFATVKVLDSLIENNNASLGGALLSSGKLEIENTTVRSNSAEFGGGLYIEFEKVTVYGSTFSENSANQGGAINVDFGELSFTNSTLSSNHATESGGGVFIGPAGTANLRSSTIAFNTAENADFGTGEGGGIFNIFGGSVTASHTIISNNIDQVGRPECAGPLMSEGFNLILNPSGCEIGDFGSDITEVDPMLGPLDDNGGLTKTHGIGEDSPAVDAGDVSGCNDESENVLTSDQRGVRRPADGNEDGSAICDIGSYELSPPIVTLYSTGDSFIRRGRPNLNEGANPLLRVTNLFRNRAFVNFNLDDVSTEGLLSATLVLSIDPEHPPRFWGRRGGELKAYSLRHEWVEGNGKSAGLRFRERTRGEGVGITWKCAGDSDISNYRPNCESEWEGGSLAVTEDASDSRRISNRLTGEITWNVTDDVLQGNNFGWMIKNRFRDTGTIHFYSREGATLKHDQNLAPRLVLEYDQ